MTLRTWLLSVLAICFLGMTAWAQGQSANFGGLGSAGGLSPSSYQSLGTVPALAGQSNTGSSGQLSRSGRAGRHGDGSRFYSLEEDSRQSAGYGLFYPATAFGGAGYYEAYNAYGYPYGYDGGSSGYQGQAPQAGNESAGGNTSQQNANQQPNQNQQPNEKQKAKEETKPEGPRYLTYTKEANPGLDAGKATGTQSSVDIKSVPAGADVTVNGYYVGRTPTTVQLPPGHYIITVNKWGYVEWNYVLEVSGGKPASVSPTLHEDW